MRQTLRSRRFLLESLVLRIATGVVLTALVVYTDGACRGNPGVSSAGWYIVDAVGGDIERGGEYLGHGTNNEAEYRAAILGLEAVVRHGAQEVTLRSDSELMVRQLTGIYRVKKANIRP